MVLGFRVLGFVVSWLGISGLSRMRILTGLF